MELFFVIIGLIFVGIGVVSIYDARKITNKWFSFQDKNEGTKYLKIFGFLAALLGIGIIYSYFPDAIEIIKRI